MAHMGGMEEMSVFYEDCLEELYPPGICGTFCNEHTYDVLVACTGTRCLADSQRSVCTATQVQLLPHRDPGGLLRRGGQ